MNTSAERVRGLLLKVAASDALCQAISANLYGKGGLVDNDDDTIWITADNASNILLALTFLDGEWGLPNDDPADYEFRDIDRGACQFFEDAEHDRLDRQEVKLHDLCINVRP